MLTWSFPRDLISSLPYICATFASSPLSFTLFQLPSLGQESSMTHWYPGWATSPGYVTSHWMLWKSPDLSPGAAAQLSSSYQLAIVMQSILSTVSFTSPTPTKGCREYFQGPTLCTPFHMHAPYWPHSFSQCVLGIITHHKLRPHFAKCSFLSQFIHFVFPF